MDTIQQNNEGHKLNHFLQTLGVAVLSSAVSAVTTFGFLHHEGQPSKASTHAVNTADPVTFKIDPQETVVLNVISDMKDQFSTLQVDTPTPQYAILALIADANLVYDKSQYATTGELNTTRATLALASHLDHIDPAGKKALRQELKSIDGRRADIGLPTI